MLRRCLLRQCRFMGVRSHTLMLCKVPTSTDEPAQNSKPKPKKVKPPPRVKAVPATPTSRAAGFLSLGVKLGVSAATQIIGSKLGMTDANAPKLTPGSLESLVTTLCNMRGCALKLGQLLSMQDQEIIPKGVLIALERVRDSASIMPESQLKSVLVSELGQNWQDKFSTFEMVPIASASIGQVHRAKLAGSDKEVAVKVQYPGVADSIDSDVDNLLRLFKVPMLKPPPGLFIENVLRELRRELKEEVDYEIEAGKLQKFKELLEAETSGADDPNIGKLSDFFSVPSYIPELSTKKVLTVEYVRGIPVDQLEEKGVDQEIRDRVGLKLMQLTLSELFRWRFMQTDPNFTNFLYNAQKNKVHLVDFGACRQYSDEFVNNYYNIVHSAKNEDAEGVLEYSKRIKMLKGTEVDIMREAHVGSVFAIGVPFRDEAGIHDYREHNISKQISSKVRTMLKHREQAPPTEVYSLHRRLSGLFMVLSRLGARFDSRPLIAEAWQGYKPGE
eukprot:TRINITY_DN49403_c0_g1_i1.p1 TRINITY_DN49403_c0_g1~~TRINITY_DN49403_c0_g1_i1.p1  ORF type:complete len:501 (-),score=19.09 TRINITY_DN49403_c0_g1_i1:1353-2855(-)